MGTMSGPEIGKEKPQETPSHPTSEQPPEIVTVRINLLRRDVDTLKEIAARRGVSVYIS